MYDRPSLNRFMFWRNFFLLSCLYKQSCTQSFAGYQPTSKQKGLIANFLTTANIAQVRLWHWSRSHLRYYSI